MSRPLLGFVLVAAACRDGGSSSTALDMEFDGAGATANVDHAHAPLPPGVTFQFQERAEDPGPAVEMTRTVSHFATEVDGTKCRTIVVRERRDGELVVERFEHYAEDRHGNVWLLGVDAAQLVNGEVVGREGSWRAGDSGARAGLVLPAEPEAGIAFAREDGGRRIRSQIESVGDRVRIDELGALDDCVRLLESEAGDPARGATLRILAPRLGEVRVRRGGTTRNLIGVLDDARPEIVPERFVAAVDHPYLPLFPGTIWRYRGAGDDEGEELIVEVLDERRTILGVECTTVSVQEIEHGSLVEHALDWLAQDRAGNVWYFGSDVTEYEDGIEVGTDESWLAGEAGAVPGIEMLALPRVGDSYRQELAPGAAEDLAIVHALGVEVVADLGTFEDCLVVRERNPLEPDSANELKSYAPFIGLVHEEEGDGSGSMTLVEVGG